MDDLASPRLQLAGALLTRRVLLLRRARARLLRSRGFHAGGPSIFRAARRARCKGVGRAARLCFRVAEVLRVEARRPAELRAAMGLFRLAMSGSRALRPRARERLLLMMLQRGASLTSRAVQQQLAAGGFVGLLSPVVIRYPLDAAAATGVTIPPSLAPPRPGVHAIDGALPEGMLRRLCTALDPASPFWQEHGYACGAYASPFFSYVHALNCAPRHGFERVIHAVLRHVRARFPAASQARYAEWWAHCRPHGVGHQLHFDSANEGRGALRHPIVSTALYLTSDVGGPTLVTTQASGDTSLASAGYMAPPRRNRLLMFDGRLLHGVLPGRGVVPPAQGSPPRRVTLMIAFWPSLRERPAPRPAAARPFPHAAVAAGRTGEASVGATSGGALSTATWPRLFDWSQEEDGKLVREEGAGGMASSSLLVGPVEVWRPARQGARLGEGEHMPSYDECFQTLC